MPNRCEWGEMVSGDPLYLSYHDEEWGVPSHDDRHLYEMLVLEGSQAGISWSTILKKREGYRNAFRDFDVAKVARFGRRDVERLLQDASIVRHRGKIEAAIANAQATLLVAEELGSLDAFLWGFVDGTPIRNAWKALAQIPTETDGSRVMSKELKRRGFRFVGPTACYAFMQACGLVNDHEVGCFRWKQVSALA